MVEIIRNGYNYYDINQILNHKFSEGMIIGPDKKVEDPPTIKVYHRVPFVLTDVGPVVVDQLKMKLRRIVEIPEKVINNLDSQNDRYRIRGTREEVFDWFIDQGYGFRSTPVKPRDMPDFLCEIAENNERNRTVDNVSGGVPIRRWGSHIDRIRVWWNPESSFEWFCRQAERDWRY